MPGRRTVEGGVAVVVRRVDVRLRPDERLHALPLAVPAREVQRRAPLAVLQIHLRAVLQQLLERLVVTVRRRRVKVRLIVVLLLPVLLVTLLHGGGAQAVRWRVWIMST